MLVYVFCTETRWSVQKDRNMKPPLFTCGGIGRFCSLGRLRQNRSLRFLPWSFYSWRRSVKLPDIRGCKNHGQNRFQAVLGFSPYAQASYLWDMTLVESVLLAVLTTGRANFSPKIIGGSGKLIEIWHRHFFFLSHIVHIVVTKIDYSPQYGRPHVASSPGT